MSKATLYTQGKPLRATTHQELFDQLVKEKIEFLDLCFCDPHGYWQHCTITDFSVEQLKQGVFFDGSSIKLFTKIDSSDMVMVPDITTAWINPFIEYRTAHIISNVYTANGKPYERCPRQIAQKAEQLLTLSGVADTAYFGPEPEFFVFDSVRACTQDGEISVIVETDEGPWKNHQPSQRVGMRNPKKSMYFPTQPLDQMVHIRNTIMKVLKDIGLHTEKHHHEVAVGQSEIGFRYDTLVKTADNLMIAKYVTRNVAEMHNKTATFMPKPIHNDAGSGCHIHQSLWKNSENLFSDASGAQVVYSLSKTALHYIGGIFKHIGAISAFTNPTTNSYKRLIPGFEAPNRLVYGEANRSAAIRIPIVPQNNAALKRLECRFPDGTACPYLALSALLLAGIDGIIQKIDPPPPCDANAYAMQDTKNQAKCLPSSLLESIQCLENDYEFLLRGNVFSKNFLDDYIKTKKEEHYAVSAIPHPIEFQMYFNQ